MGGRTFESVSAQWLELYHRINKLAGTADAPTVDVDEYQSDVYLCRWPNGEFSVVNAPWPSATTGYEKQIWHKGRFG
jgi:hypothetical protein